MRCSGQELPSCELKLMIYCNDMNSGSTSEPAVGLPVAVLGGGITGLCAAWHLARARVPVVLIEASGRVGGAIESIHRDGWLHESGPNSVLEGASCTEEII